MGHSERMNNGKDYNIKRFKYKINGITKRYSRFIYKIYL